MVTPHESGGWRLEIPKGRKGTYRLAQLDDYYALPRNSFPYQPNLKFKLAARASSENIPGTWGFGLWNDPFALSFLRKPPILRLPVLPNAAWFFFATSHNYLSLRDDLPAEGSLMATFRSPRLPSILLLPAITILPGLLIPPVARQLRQLGRLVIQQDSALLSHNPTEWHNYGLEWSSTGVVFEVDGGVAFKTRVTPNPPMGLVIWVDNQFASTPPDGRFRYGRLANHEPAWIEVKQLEVMRL